MHVTSEPAILYFGTPVVLISTVNEDGSFNLAPMSSAFWLGWRCVIGLGAASKTTQNLIRTRQGVLNLPSSDQAAMASRTDSILRRVDGAAAMRSSGRPVLYLIIHYISISYKIELDDFSPDSV